MNSYGTTKSSTSYGQNAFSWKEIEVKTETTLHFEITIEKDMTSDEENMF